MSPGKTVRMFLVDGTPGGLLTAEIGNWTGHVVAAPRSDLGALLNRSECGRTGVYILTGDNPDNPDELMAYIGEGDDVGRRLVDHARAEDQGGKDFWDRAVVLTSKDANLTKAHARYLESRFISLALKAGRAQLASATAPQPNLLPEADQSDMETFLAEAIILLPVLGINILRVPGGVKESISEQEEVGAAMRPATFQLYFRRDDVLATAKEIDGEFTVLEGSLARLDWSGVDDGYRRLREKLEREGTLVPTDSGTAMRFVYDQAFRSPSAAAAVVAGRSANGRVEWKVAGTAISYGTWQEGTLV
jgi:Domain of unknown function (DUF4357)